VSRVINRFKNSHNDTVNVGEGPTSSMTAWARTYRKRDEKILKFWLGVSVARGSEGQRMLPNEFATHEFVACQCGERDGPT